jgi:glycosyltransferase involved in cell wall biosynthesis
MVSILLSTYNGGLYLVEQLNSIIGQTYKNWKLWIRDDGSTDNTIDIINEYRNLYPEQISFMKDDLGNLKPAASFMQLLSLIDADYYMFCDQDDVWLHNKIEKTLHKMQEKELIHSNIPVLIFSNLYLVDSNLKQRKRTKWEYEQIRPKSCNNFYYLLACAAITGCTIMINRIAKKEVLPYTPPLMHDRWIPLILSRKGIIDYVDEPLILYRIHDSNAEGLKKRDISHYVHLVLNFNKTVKRIKISTKRYDTLPYKYNKLLYCLYVLKINTYRLLKL